MILKGFYFRENEYRLSIMLFNMIVKRPNKVFTLLWQEGVAYRIMSDRSQNPNIFFFLTTLSLQQFFALLSSK